MNTPTKCSKCGNEMRSGFIPDFRHGGTLVGSWHEGEPRKSFLMGVRAAPEKGKPIRAFRCSSCGYLELYADDDFKAR